MSSETLERRIVQVLSCEANQQVLARIVSEEHGVVFQYIASEFPILTPDGYGYPDVIGIDRNTDSAILIECKADSSLLQDSIAESEYYRKCIATQGLLQNRDLIGLYHRALIGGMKLSNDFEVRPLILDQANLARHSSPPLSERARALRANRIISDGVAKAKEIGRLGIQVVIRPVKKKTSTRKNGQKSLDIFETDRSRRGELGQ